MCARFGNMPVVRVCVFSVVAIVSSASGAHAQTTVINNQTVTAPPFVIPDNDNLTVGSTGTAVLNIQEGIVVTTSVSILGDAAGSSGTVNVSGAGTEWITTEDLTIGNQGSGTLNVTGLGTVNSQTVYLGYTNDGPAIANITGAGAEWTVANSLYVGYSGDATLTASGGSTLTLADVYIGYAEDGNGIVNITTGSTVTSEDLYLGYYGDNMSGTLNLSGVGTQWDVTGSIYTVYDYGIGIINVTAGAVLTATGDLTLGSYGREQDYSTMTVSGTGSQVQITGDATVGDGAVATLTVENNGSFSSDELTVGDGVNGTMIVRSGGDVTSGGATIADGSDSVSSATVTGAGSTWTNTGMTVGAFGRGTMSITAGGVVTSSGTSTIASSDGSVGTVTISGVGSLWTTNGLTVGDDGTGTLNVLNGAHLELGNNTMYVGGSEGDGTVNLSGGATITSGEVYLGYYGSTPTGTANVSGAGTVWNMGYLTVGYEGGAGELNISSGAQVISSSSATFGYYDEGVTRGDVTITGTGSLLSIASDLTIGYSAESTVVISNGGRLEVGSYSTVSSDETSPSSVTVTGQGSEWTSDGLYIGYYGEGTVNITNGATVTSTDDIYLGYYSYSYTHGIVNISGSNSALTVDGDAYLSYEGRADLTVSNGGLFDVTGTTYVGEGEVANVTITGSGSKWNSGDIEIGNYSSSSYPNAEGNVVVSAGADVTTGTLGIGTGGSTTPGVGNLLVTGSGSTIVATGATTIGTFGTAVARLTNGGSLSTASVSIATEATGSGTLIFGAAADQAAVATGRLNASTVTFGPGSGEIVFNHTSNLTFASGLSGTGNIQVLSGTTTFTGNSSGYTGDVGVTGGKAVFNANVGGDVEVSGSGIVGGDGTINTLDVITGGTVAPGNSPGTLVVTGGVTFGTGTNYNVEVDGAKSDKISAGGAATISGGTVHVDGGVPSLKQYAILTATGGVTGTFAALDTSSLFVLYSLDYDANNVYLVVDGFNSVALAARTPNELAVARALDQLKDNPVYAAVVAQSNFADVREALNALSGEVHSSVSTALADDSRYVREAILGRLIQAYYSGAASPAGGQAIVLASAAPTNVIDGSSRMSLGAGYGEATAAPSGGHALAFWSRAFGAWGQYDTNGNAATMDRSLGGFVSGVDGNLGGGWRAGLATGYTYTGLDVDARNSSANINSYVLGGYAGGAVGSFAIRSGGTWTWHDIDTSRTVVFPGFLQSESANYGGNTGQLFAEVAHPFISANHVIEPFAGLAYVHVGTNSFAESGGDAAVTSGGSDGNLGVGTLGARAGTTVLWGGSTVIPHASLAWQYAFGDTTPFQVLALTGTDVGFGIGGVPIAQNSALLEVGADVLIGAEATLGLSYLGQYAGDVTDNGLRGRFNWRY